jgi:hypothetical protein
MKRADEMMPLLKAHEPRLKRDLDSLKKDLKRATAHFEGAEKRAYDRAKTELEGKIEEAVESGDLQAARAAMKEMGELKPKAMTGRPESTARKRRRTRLTSSARSIRGTTRPISPTPRRSRSTDGSFSTA